MNQSIHRTSPSIPLAAAYGNRITTPLAAPLPPPRRSDRGTLGPVFSDEEDGDDSDFIAMKMAQLGMDPGQVYAKPRNESNRQSPAGFSPQQLAQLLGRQEAMFSQPMDQTLAMFQLQQAQLTAAQLQLQAQANLQVQAQMHLQAQAQAQAAILARQFQSGRLDQNTYQRALHELQRRLQLQLAAVQQQTLSQSNANNNANTSATRSRENDIRALFESAPNTRRGLEPSPIPKEETSKPMRAPSAPAGRNAAQWRSTNTTPTESKPAPSRTPTGRFAQARQSMTAPLTDLLRSRDNSNSDSASTTSETSDHRIRATSDNSPSSTTDYDHTAAKAAAREGILALGHGRPANSNASQPPSARAATTPTIPVSSRVEREPRAVSYAGRSMLKAVVIREPYGPPGDLTKLKEENFKSLARRKAGLGLGMLGRRTEPTTPTLVD